MSDVAAVRLRLEEFELPAGPGSLVRVLVNDGGHGEFFGPEGPRLGWGYSVKVNGDLWRGVLETVTAVPGGSRVTLRIDGRYAGRS